MRPANLTFETKARLVLLTVLLEFILFIFSGVSLSFLKGDVFFNIGVDPVFWLFYLAGIPQFIVSNQWLGIAIDVSIVMLLILFIRDVSKHIVAACIFILMLGFYVTLTGYLTHRNYQFGFVLVFIPFMFKNRKSTYFAYEAVRYFLLFFYTSPAFIKIFAGAIQDKTILGSFLTKQFTPYYLEGNTGWRTGLNLYLIEHPTLSHILFIAGLLIELITVIGFFTKRFDNRIAALLIVFHLGNWIIMDIGAIGQVGFISLLFLSRHYNYVAGRNN